MKAFRSLTPLRLSALLILLASVAGSIAARLGTAARHASSSGSGRAPASEGPEDADRFNELYDRLFPLSVDVCGLTSLHKNPGIGLPMDGFVYGHAVMYLHGACLDRDAGYTRLGICDAPAPGAPSGVGISVDGEFTNAHWSGVEDRDFFYFGLQKDGSHLDESLFRKTIQNAEAMGFLDAVEIHPDTYKQIQPGMSRNDVKYEKGYGTEYAINDARRMYCARTPLDRWQLERIVAYLNERNRRSHFDEEYRWSLTNNCATTVLGSLARAGILDAVPAEVQTKAATLAVAAAADLAVPLNLFNDVMDRANDLPLENLAYLYRDVSARHLLLEKGILPTRAGGIATYFPSPPRNEIFRSGTEGRLFDVPGIHLKSRAMKTYFTDSRYSDLKANLVYFLARLRALKAGQRPWTEYFPPTASKQKGTRDETEQKRFYDRFFAFVDEELRATESRLGRLESARSGE